MVVDAACGRPHDDGGRLEHAHAKSVVDGSGFLEQQRGESKTVRCRAWRGNVDGVTDTCVSSQPRLEPDLGRIKGAAFREFVAWCEGELGQARLVAVARELPPGVRHELALDLGRDSLGILSSRWYDAAAMHALVEVIFMEIDAGARQDATERAADAVMRSTLRGVYRILFEWLATPERYARFADRLWRSYYDSGEMRVELVRSTAAACTIRGWRAHHPRLCELNRAAASAIYRAMGCTDVTTRREACIDEGADACRFVTTWSIVRRA